MQNATAPGASPLADHFAGSVRAHLGREGASIAQLATVMGVGSVWLSRRLGARRSVDITVDEAYLVADAIGVPLTELLGDWRPPVAS